MMQLFPVAIGRLYGTEAWRCRAKRQLELEPLCRVCLAQARIDVARVADHVRDHKRDLRIFWEGELQCLVSTTTKKLTRMRRIERRDAAWQGRMGFTPGSR
jgi:hypothetical protein